MHQCLKIPEIVEMICAALDPQYSAEPWSFSTRHLAILARTCTSFSGPALDHLWVRAPLSRILISCMPPDLWAKDPPQSSRPRDKPQIDIWPRLRSNWVSDWDRVKFYTHRVKILSSGTSHRWSLSSVFPALSVSLPDGLFPNLRVLYWHHSNDDFHHVHRFLGLTITKISLTISSDANSSLFSTLATKCPKLVDISVSTINDEKFEMAVSEFVRSLQCVQKIDIPSLDQRALEHISFHDSQRIDVALLAQSPTFSALHQLTLTCHNIKQTTAFLQWCSGVPLIEFHVEFWALASRSGVDSFFAAVSAGFLHSSLTNLSMECEYDDPDSTDPDRHLISLQSLRHIFSFVNLTELVIVSPVEFDLDNDGVTELARAFPRVVTLRLAIVLTGSMPRATLSCLHSFAQHCPLLRALIIALDARAVPNHGIDPRVRFVQHTLLTINVEHSPLVEPFHAARFLSGVFPNLAKVLTTREYLDNESQGALLEDGTAIRLHRRWKRVQWLLPQISAFYPSPVLLMKSSQVSVMPPPTDHDSEAEDTPRKLLDANGDFQLLDQKDLGIFKLHEFKPMIRTRDGSFVPFPGVMPVRPVPRPAALQNAREAMGNGAHDIWTATKFVPPVADMTMVGWEEYKWSSGRGNPEHIRGDRSQLGRQGEKQVAADWQSIGSPDRGARFALAVRTRPNDGKCLKIPVIYLTCVRAH
ncbi:hypothetical protein C8R45DRAFT_1066868 [Mycena sanguinolenta]|nr:hypothetical protein C8R45DRAFT_1066868 [Mycena sanguinolenta]